MPFENPSSIINFITRHCDAECLKAAISDIKGSSAFGTSVRGGVQGTIGRYVGIGFIGGLLPFPGGMATMLAAYAGFRLSKHQARKPLGLDETIESNPKAALMMLLNADGGNDRLSYKWDLLKAVYKQVHEKNSHLTYNEHSAFLRVSYEEYTDNDTSIFIEELKLSLMDVNNKNIPTQVMAILETYIKNNTPSISWLSSEPESVGIARQKLREMRVHYGSSADISLIGTDNPITIIKDILKIEPSESSRGIEEKNIQMLFMRVSGYLDIKQMPVEPELFPDRARISQAL
jgi:hypothetical protein